VIRHRHLGPLELKLHLVGNLDAITPHLKQNPVDLLIYDERGGIPAIEAAESIQKDVNEFAQLWGPDFLFPMGRVVMILNGGPDAARRAFILGRDHVQDVMIDPKGVVTIMFWLARLLADDAKIATNKTGLALSGGGIEGFLYQLGAMKALESAIAGFSANDFDLYSGISSGSILGALLASKVPVNEIILAVHGKSTVMPALKSATIFDLATKDILSRVGVQSTVWSGLDPNKWIQKTLRSVPTGIFKGEKLRTYFSESIRSFGCDDKFTSLTAELYIGATDQDTFEHVVLGTDDWKDVDISDAVRASCALPPFFTPMKIRDRWFVDGQITKTCNLDLAVKKGCRLVMIIDPLKPHPKATAGAMDKEGGVYALIQTVKALVYTRFRTALQQITDKYPQVDFMVFQPDEECAQAMAGSPMRYRIRTEIIDLAFRSTLRKLRERHTVYVEKLAKFDLKLSAQQTLLEIERKGLEF
jgi:predicted acylesterase/phospholipase RssA